MIKKARKVIVTLEFPASLIPVKEFKVGDYMVFDYYTRHTLLYPEQIQVIVIKNDNTKENKKPRK